MSEYGRLWEQARAVREELARLLCRDVPIDSIHMARKHAESHVKRINVLLESWEDLERKMNDAE